MSLRSPRGNGFQQLPNEYSNYTRDMNYESDIPLTNVRTGASTGGRRPGDTIAQTTSQTPLTEEKGGLFKRGLGGRRKQQAPMRRGTDGEEISVNPLGRFYHRVVNFSVVTRYIVYVLPIALLIAAPIIIYAIINPNAEFVGMGVRVYLFWTWIEVLWLSLWVSKLVAKAVPFIFMFLCGVVSSGTRKYAMMLKAVEIPLSLVGWAVTGLVTFTALMAPGINFNDNPRWITVVKNLLGPALIAALIYLVEQSFIQLISVNYHRRSFDGRIKDSKHVIHLLGMLFDASRTLFPMYCPEFVEEDYMINDSIEALMGHHMGHAKKGSLTPLRIINNFGRMGDKVTSAFGNIASEITGKHVFNPHSAHSIVIEALEKTRSSEALAKRIWMSFVVEGKEALYLDDFQEVLGPAYKEEAEEAFIALDSDGNGDISLDEMIMKVVEVGRERTAISSSMRDVGQAIGVLDQVLSLILFVIIIFIFVAFQDTNFVTTLATAGTTLLSLSFVFSVTAQEFLGSCIFLFVKHPYDVGDRVDIVGPKGTSEFLVVEQISLLYTTFKRIDNMKMVQVPNIVLNALWIENITRSKAMKEQLDMFISFDTSLEDIETLRTEMENFVRHTDNARDFYPDIILEATGIGAMDKLQLKIEIRHKSNWHNETVRASRRSKFMCALVLALRKVPIYAPGGGFEPLGGPTNPGYSVSVEDTWAVEAREKAEQAKEAKRLIPTNTAASVSDSKYGGTLGPLPEEAAANSLNARRPTLDTAHEQSPRRGSSNSRSEDTSAVRDPSQDGKRSTEIESIRQDLVQRKSTRGRRRRGETAPSVPSVPSGSSGPGGPGGPALSLTVTQPSPRHSPRPSPQVDQGFLSRGQRDEESELGVYEMGDNRHLGERGEGDYDTYQAQHQPGPYNRYPQGTDDQQLLPGPTSPQTRLQRLSLGLGNLEDRDEPFL